jgi:hypothetical protein
MKTKQISGQTMPVILMEPTPNFRWLVKRTPIYYRHEVSFNVEKTLQQEFICINTGKTEWRDIEEVHEKQF